MFFCCSQRSAYSRAIKFTDYFYNTVGVAREAGNTRSTPEKGSQTPRNPECQVIAPCGSTAGG